MKKLKDVLADGSTFSISLKKLIGQEIVDIEGYISNEWGEPLFSISSVILTDGTKLFIGGEHDNAYLEDGVEDEQLQSLYYEVNGTNE